jgi:hypothetical protein
MATKIPEETLHKFVWSEGKFKDHRLVAVPQNYLRAFIEANDKNKKDRTAVRLCDLAKAELIRRGPTPVFVHFTEHAIERFTERDEWIRAFILYHRITKKGLASFVKELFLKAIETGTTTLAQGNQGRNYHVKRKGFRWTYGLYQADPKKGYEYKIVTVVPTRG